MPVINFDANQVEPYEGNFDPIPADWYVMAVESSEIRPNSAQTGSILSLKYTILDGPYANRKVFENLNIQHPNAAAVEIAYKKLSSICRATGVINLQNSEQLHNIPFKGKVKLRAANGQYEASNEVTMWKHVSEQVETSSQAANAPIPNNVPHQSQPMQQPAPQFAQAQQPWNQPAAQQPPAQAQQPMQAQQPTQNQPWNQPANNQATNQPWNPPAAQQPVNQNVPQNGAAPQPGSAPMPPWSPRQ